MCASWQPLQSVQPEAIERQGHAPSGRAHGTYEIEKCLWVSMERK